MTHKSTILIAEDDHSIRELLSHAFGQNGFTVLMAENGHSALEIAAAHISSIDLLVTDIQMPGMNGVDLAKELKRNRPGLAVLLISSYVDGTRILQSGWHFLKKPFGLTDIMTKVNEVLGDPPSTAMDRHLR